MIGIINASLDRVRTVLLLFALITIAGIVAFRSIPQEAQPDITVPFVYISLGLEGISPQDADRLLVNPITKQIKSLEGLKEYSSVATEGHASVTLEFDSSVDIDKALDDVRRQVDRAKNDLPADADEPSVNEINLALFPVINVNLFGDLDDRVLYAVADALQSQIESLGGVLEAPILGKRDEIAEIIVNPSMLASYNLSNEELVSTVRRNNQLVAAGNLDTGAGRFSVKVPGLLETEEDILNLPIKSVDNSVVRFRDVAIGQRTYADFQQISRVNGQPAVTLEVTKRVGENLIGTIQDVKDTVEASRHLWPEGLQVIYTADQSTEIERTLRDLFNSVILATILVVVVMLWTLGPRSSILVGIAIPGSFLASILILYMMGITLNIIVLFALILCVGILVDGAIVVTEYADRRMSEGAPRIKAYREASTRMAWPVISSTATTLAVFMPLLFWPGIVGDFMSYLPITVIVTLGASLVVALIVIPSLGTIFGKAATVSARQRRNLAAAAEGDIDRMTGFSGVYVWALSKMLHVPILVLAGVFFIIAALGASYAKFGTGVEFFPNIDSDFGNITVRARGNLSLTERDYLVRQVEDRILGMREVKSINTLTSGGTMNNYSADTIGVFQLEFVHWEFRGTGEEVMDNIVAQTADIPGIIVEKKALAMGPTAGVDIQLDFLSENAQDLRQAVAFVTEKFSNDQRFSDVSNNLPLDGLEWRIDVDREAASRFGADLASVGNALKMITTGLTIGSYRPTDSEDELDIRIRYPFDGRDLDQIERLTISARGEQVPISNFIERRAQSIEGDLLRTDGQLSHRVEANVRSDYAVADIIAELTREFPLWVESGEFPDNVQPVFRGDQENQDESSQFLAGAFGIALFIMLVILVTQFNSIYQALVILSAIVFSSAGVLLGLLITGKPFGIVMCGVGIIALAGIVVNNNIVLIDTYNKLKGDGDLPYQAAIKTAAQRLRPILLTTITTILGLMPLVLQVNLDLMARSFTVGAPSAQWWTQLSTAIAGGLAFATILTLVLTPCLLVGIDDTLAKLKTWYNRPRPPKQPTQEVLVTTDS
ncbi:MAG: efflux RND transporter permease subunit [Natronospirillum sp.]